MTDMKWKTTAEDGANVDPWVWLHILNLESEHLALEDPASRNTRIPGRSNVSVRGLPLIIKLRKSLAEEPLDEVNLEPLFARNARAASIVTGFLKKVRRDEDGRQLRLSVADLRRLRDKVDALKTSRPVRHLLHDGIAAMGLLDSKEKDTSPADAGRGVVIGFIDNGCPVGHPNFISRSGRSRIRAIWSQSRRIIRKDAAKSVWRVPREFFNYGLEVADDAIDAAIAAGGGMQDVHDALGYQPQEIVRGKLADRFTHGGHVMDIACGRKGVAPGAEAIFVQLPPYAIRENSSEASARHILDGVGYIFARAGDRPAVVNISYGAFAGAHDGTSLVEQGIDALLEGTTNRAVVISAGNGFESECHAEGTLRAGAAHELSWMIYPDDPSENLLEIWHPHSDSMTIEVVPPSGPSSGELQHNGRVTIAELRTESRATAFAVYRAEDSLNGADHALIALGPSRESGLRRPEKFATAPAGIWKVVLRNKSAKTSRFHAWIERDDRGMRPAGEQSRFLNEVTPNHTISSICSGKHTVIVGAYNPATGRVLPFSSAGPTVHLANRSLAPRSKPDVYAPGATDFAGRGVLAAAVGNATRIRLFGTSMAAPFVSGLIALMLQRAAEAKVDLDPGTIRHLLVEASKDSEELRLPDRKPRNVPKSWTDPRSGARGLDGARALELLDAWIAKNRRPTS